MNNIVRRINQLIENQSSEKPDIKPESTFEEVGIDSLGMFDLVTAIEDEFDLMLPTESVENVKNVQGIYDAVSLMLDKNAV